MNENPVVHFEMPYDNQERVANFYQKAFGWGMNKTGPEMGNYVTAQTADSEGMNRSIVPGTINGGFFPRKADWPDQYPSVVIAVEDIQEAMKNVREAEGEVLGEPMMIPGVGLYVSFHDTEGNRVSLLQAQA